MEQEKFSARRNYSAQFRTLVLEQCAAPGASVAKVALSHGMNANVVHRWRQEARDSASSVGVREFVPVSVPAPTHTTHQDCADIRIELRLSVITQFDGLMFTLRDGQGGKDLQQNGTGIATGAVLAMSD